MIVGGVLGAIDRPEVVIAGRYGGDDLVVVGRTVPLTDALSAELGAVLRPAKPGHPWPDEVASHRWGGRDALKPLTKVQPAVGVEVLADAAMQAGQWRHGLRYLRYRADLRLFGLERGERSSLSAWRRRGKGSGPSRSEPSGSR